MKVQVREANLADAGLIARVHVDSTRTTYAGIMPEQYLAGLTYGGSESRWARMLGADQGIPTTVVVEIGDQGVVGFARGGLESQGNNQFTGELHIIYILQEFHHMGLGRRLMSAIAARLLSNGIGSMLVWVLEDNHPARRFFESMGGEHVGWKLRPTGGTELAAVSYGWKNLAGLVDLGTA